VLCIVTAVQSSICQLKKISDSIAAAQWTVTCREKDKNIIRRTYGRQKLVPSVAHTKVKAKKTSKSKEGAKLFPSGNRSGIANISIQKHKKISSKGNAKHIPLEQLIFCTYCNRHVESMNKHAKRCRQHTTNVESGVEYWFCKTCCKGHMKGNSCKPSTLTHAHVATPSLQTYITLVTGVASATDAGSGGSAPCECPPFTMHVMVALLQPLHIASAPQPTVYTHSAIAAAEEPAAGKPTHGGDAVSLPCECPPFTMHVMVALLQPLHIASAPQPTVYTHSAIAAAEKPAAGKPTHGVDAVSLPCKCPPSQCM
jgi:hypothetical protein